MWTEPVGSEGGAAPSLRIFNGAASPADDAGIPLARSQVICIASGKGGTGKTMIATNLAVALAQLGSRVSLVDADFGLANAHLMLGVEPRGDISDVLTGRTELDRIVTRGPLGVHLVPGGTGSAKLAMSADGDIDRIMRSLAGLEEDSDIVVVDLAAGMSPRVMRFLASAHDIVLVANHEVTARSDILGTIGMLAETLGAATVHLVINMARDRAHAVVTFQQIWSRVNHAWRGRIKLFFSGWLPKSHYVQSSIMRGRPIVLAHPQSVPALCLKTMGQRLHKHHMVWRSRQVGRWGVPSAFLALAPSAPSAAGN
jgi:flagellar biosynthesis protein FlhG